MKKKLVFALLTLPLLAFAQNESFSYKGVALRSSKAEFQQKLPLYQCIQDKCTYSRSTCQGSTAGIESDRSLMDAYIKRGEECRDGTSFGGISAIAGTVSFDEKGMAEVDLITSTPQMPRLAEAVELRFGRPLATNTAPVKSQTGAEFENWRKVWQAGDGVLTLVLRSVKAEQGRVFLITRERVTEFDAQRKQKAIAGSRDF